MNGLVAYDSSDSETDEQQEFEGHLGHLKKQTPEKSITNSPPKRKPSAGSIASPAQKPLGMRFFSLIFIFFTVKNFFWLKFFSGIFFLFQNVKN